MSQCLFKQNWSFFCFVKPPGQHLKVEKNFKNAKIEFWWQISQPNYSCETVKKIEASIFLEIQVTVKSIFSLKGFWLNLSFAIFLKWKKYKEASFYTCEAMCYSTNSFFQPNSQIRYFDTLLHLWYFVAPLQLIWHSNIISLLNWCIFFSSS